VDRKAGNFQISQKKTKFKGRGKMRQTIIENAEWIVFKEDDESLTLEHTVEDIQIKGLSRKNLESLRGIIEGAFRNA
jgi:hypothetical protein